MATITSTVRKLLQERSAWDLARIGEAWAIADLGVDGQSTPDSGFHQSMLNILQARFAWSSLSPEAREILHQMIELEVIDGVPREDIQKLAGLSTESLVTALTQLEQNFMLYEKRPDNRVRQRLEERGREINYVLAAPNDFRPIFKAIHQEIYGLDRTRLPLAVLLATLGPESLREIGALNAVRVARDTDVSQESSASLETLAQMLAKTSAIKQAWSRLGETERQICSLLGLTDGQALVADIQAELKLPRAELARSLQDLETSALAFSTFRGQDHLLFVEQSIFKHLHKLVQTIEKSQERAGQFAATLDGGENPPVVREGWPRVLSDLAVVVNTVCQMAVEPTQSGALPKRIVNKILPLLHITRPNYYDDSDNYPDIIFSVAQGLELIRLLVNKGQKARYVPGPRLKAWGRLAAFEQARLLLELWEKSSTGVWSDVAGVYFEQDNFRFHYYMDMRSARQGLLAYLAEQCQPGRWYALKPFLQTIKNQRPQVLRPKMSYGFSQRDLLAGWDNMDGEIITGMLSSTLHEMGLVSLGYQTEATVAGGYEQVRNPDAFAFTELAAQVLWEQQKPASEREQAHTLIVQPNFELLLLQPDYSTLYKVLPFTKAEQIDMVSRLTLTQASVRSGVEAGYSVEQIISTLQENSQKELPQNVLYTLQDWGRMYKNATISQVILVEVGSEAAADEIFASSKLRALELRRLGPCAIAVGSQVSLQALRTALEKEGIILYIQGDILSARDVATTATSYGRRR